RMFVVRDLNQAVKPATMMTTKVTIKSMEYAELLGGVVQAAMGDAIVDCLAEDILPRDQAEELCMIITVWLDPRCAEDGDLDRQDLYRTKSEAARLAITRAMTGKPTADELIANRKTIKHYALDGVIDY